MSRQKNYIFQGSFLWYDGRGELVNTTPTKVMMVEDINDPCRTWVMDFMDETGINEFIGLWKKQEDQILVYGNYATPLKKLNACVVRIQDVQVKNIYTEDAKFKGIRIKCVEIFDLFLSVGFKEKKGWKNITAHDLFKDVFSTLGDGYTVEAPEYGNPINIPLLLNPYWSKAKLLKYVNDNYVFGGPGKILVTYENEGNRVTSAKIGMYPLQYIMLGLYGEGIPLKVEPDDTYLNGIKTDYFIYGPSRADRVYKNYKDQGMYLFNGMKGVEPNETSMDDFVANQVGPEFDNNSERGYVNPFYTTLNKNAEVTPKLGRILSEKSTEKGISTTNMVIDCEPKPIAQHKTLSRFYQYYSQNFVLECTVAPSENLKLGYRYNISLPSRNQNNNVGLPDETLSGDWVLSRVEHDLYKNGERYEYRPRCYFIRTGLEKAPEVGPIPEQVVDKSLEEKKVKSNETAVDKLANAKADAKGKIKGAKDKVGGVVSKATSKVTSATENVKGSLGKIQATVGDTVSGATSSIGDTVGDTTSGIGDAVGGITSGIGDAVGGITSGIGDAVGGITSGIGDSNNLDKVTNSSIGDAVTGFNSIGANVGNAIGSTSTRLIGGKAGVVGFNEKSNIVTVAKKVNITELTKPDGNVKLIEGQMRIGGTNGNVNGLVKDGMENGEITKGKMLANFNDGTGNKVIVGTLDGAYDEINTSVVGSFSGDVISDRNDDEIKDSISNNETVAKEWLV